MPRAGGRHGKTILGATTPELFSFSAKRSLLGSKGPLTES